MVCLRSGNERKVAGKLFIVELFHADGSDVSYLRLLTSEKVIRREKHRFCFTFGGDWERVVRSRSGGGGSILCGVCGRAYSGDESVRTAEDV